MKKESLRDHLFLQEKKDESISLSEDQLSDLSRDITSLINSHRRDESYILRVRRELVQSLFEIHHDRILDEADGIYWSEGPETEDSEHEGSETEASEMEDSNTGKGKHKETYNNNDKGKGKGKAEETYNNNDKGKGKGKAYNVSVTNDGPLDLQFDNDIQTAIRESINDSKDTYDGESSKIAGSSRK